MNNRTTWKTSFSITPAKGLPGGVREAARQLETHMPTDTGCLWTEGEAKAAKALLENSAMVPVWSHLNQLIEFDDWFQLLVEVFIEPFGQPNKAANQNDEADGNASRYARMAEHAFGLLELLDDYRPAEGRPGHLPEVDALVDKSSLAEHLLKLIALTTACEWPKAEYADQYGLPSERPTQEDWRDCRSAETYAIWRHSTKKNGAHPGFMERDGKQYEFHSYIFRRNPRFYKRGESSPPYDYEQDCGRDVFLSKDDPLPPMFEPVSFPEYSPATTKANTPHMSYLKQAIKQLDDFSSDTLGRPPRLRGKGKSNGTGRNCPLWLGVEHWEALLNVLFPEIEISANQIRRELNKITPLPG